VHKNNNMQLNFQNEPCLGEIFYVDLSSPGKYTIDKIRPCLILWKVLRTFTVVPITKHIDMVGSTEVFIEKGKGGLKVDSRFKVGQMTTISEEQILNKMGTLPKEDFRRVIGKFESLLYGRL
jgi:mRNA-degrading endonuclease toxin of MazEF toxin-antitoxin module